MVRNKVSFSLIKKILKIVYIVLIVAIFFIVSLIIREWNLLKGIADLINIISPIIIGLFIAWLLNPLVKKLTARNNNRLFSTIIVYIFLILIIVFFFANSANL